MFTKTYACYILILRKKTSLSTSHLNIREKFQIFLKLLTCRYTCHENWHLVKVMTEKSSDDDFQENSFLPVPYIHLFMVKNFFIIWQKKKNKISVNVYDSEWLTHTFLTGFRVCYICFFKYNIYSVQVYKAQRNKTIIIKLTYR